MSQAKIKWPSGIPYIIGNEAAERFSFYGMKAILVIFMTKYLMNHEGMPDQMTQSEANSWFHTFVFFTYLTPIFGAIISDIWLGKYRTIIILSIVYCAGHLALALDETRLGLSIGLTLIAIGSGGIKPCVSAHVGDQFTRENQTIIDKAFSLFYLSINIGAMVATILTPVLLDQYGPHLAFGLPGLLMLIATIVFYLGRHKYIAIKAAGWETYKRDLFSPEGLRILGLLALIYFVFISIFWAQFDQTGSTWVFQADRMDKVINLGFFQFELLPSQIQAINPFLILVLIPVFSYIIYPWVSRFTRVTTIGKISAGLLLAVIPVLMCGIVEANLNTGGHPSIFWQFLAYLMLTIAEILVSISALEFAYTQAPNTMKSFLLGFYLIAVAIGNLIILVINKFTVVAMTVVALNAGDTTTITLNELPSNIQNGHKIEMKGDFGIAMAEGEGRPDGLYFIDNVQKENNSFEIKSATGEFVSTKGDFQPGPDARIEYNKLNGATYFWFYAGLMFIAAVIFVFIAMNYKERTYIQSEEDREF